MLDPRVARRGAALGPARTPGDRARVAARLPADAPITAVPAPSRTARR